MQLRLTGILIFIAAMTLLTSCGGGKAVSASKPVFTGKSDAAVLYETMIDEGSYTWYTGKARIKANTPDVRMSATMNLRMLRDSVIWATIDKLGFEVARVFITPDSVFVVDRLNKEYTRKSLTSFLLEYGVHIGFSDLQNVLIGRMIALTPAYIESGYESDQVMLIVSDYTGVTAKHWMTPTLPQRLLKSYLVDAGGRKLQIENVDWETFHDGTQISYGRLLLFEDTHGMTEVEISFSEITKNVPTSIPFSIPENYALAR